MEEQKSKVNPKWESATNFVETDQGRLPILPTILQDGDNNFLSLVWSSPRSLEKTLQTETGVYESRKRGLWVKSPSGVNAQKLLSIKLDCDGDALLFTVAQRGDACHLERKSCFETCWESDNQSLIIAISSGRSRDRCIELLERIGIRVYINAKSRSTEYVCKSHLHPNIKIIECKPRDLEMVLTQKLAHFAVGFSDQYVGTVNIQGCQPSHNEIKVDYVLFATSPDFKINSETKIFFEECHGDFSQQIKMMGLNISNMVYITGNAEGWVKLYPNSVGVAVCETGTTLRANGLHILSILESEYLGIYFCRQFASEQPRIIRSIKNDLAKDTIYFYSVDGPFGFMSNFYPTTYGPTKSSEHAYQAAKFKDPLLRQKILQQPTAKAAYKMAWTMQEHWRPDWFLPAFPHHEWTGEYQERDAAMWSALIEKFRDPILEKKLKDTYPKQLVEHAMKDDHFGCGLDGSGLNVLGRMLMILRDSMIIKT